MSASTRAPEPPTLASTMRSNPVSKRPPARTAATWSSAYAALLAFGLLGAPPAAAVHLVVLTTGEVVHVEGFSVDGARVELELRSGGRMVLALSRVERIVDAEVARDPSLPAAPPVPLAFDAGQPVPETPYGALIYLASRRHGLNPEVVAAIVRAESGFDPFAVSHKGARGLMQLMPATAARFGVAEAELFDPDRNLEAGLSYLRWLIGRYEGDLVRVLAAFNAGERAVDRYEGIPPYRETIGYVSRIFSFLDTDGRVAAR